MRPLAQVKRLIVHHSASPRETTLEQIDGWHREKGFEGVGYHWIIEAEGAVRQGRSPTLQGAHAKGANGDSWGVCVTGNNTMPGQQWSPVQVDALRKFVDSVRMLVPGIRVYGHRDVPGGLTRTECPGLDVRAIVGG